MYRYKRLDKFLTHAVWLIEVEDHGDFTTESLMNFNVFVTRGAADRWLYKKVFELDNVREL